VAQIPWDVTLHDIGNHLSPIKLPRKGGVAMIHVLMVRDTGKTRSDAFVEVANSIDANFTLRERQRRILKGRIVTISRSSQEELMRAVFPTFPGDFFGVDAIPPRSELLHQLSCCPSSLTNDGLFDATTVMSGDIMNSLLGALILRTKLILFLFSIGFQKYIQTSSLM
jgi:hypothetical protein